MNVLFAHDHIFYKSNNKYYSNGSFSTEVLKRYTNVFDKVVFVSRQKKIGGKTENFSKASTDNVEFVKISDFKSVKNYHKKIAASKMIESQVKKADYLIARLPSSIGSIAVKHAKKYNKPYLVEVVGCARDAYWNHGSILGKAIAPLVYYTTKKAVKSASHVIYVTSEFLQDRYPTDGVSINISNVSIDDFDDKIIEGRVKKIKKLDDEIIFGTIGALTSRYKGYDTMISALSIIKQQTNHKLEYKVLGGGDSEHIVNLAKKYKVMDSVKISGPLPAGNEVLDWLDNIDVYVQPSKTEGLPRAVIEAMSRGCPIIGSNVGGIPELLDSSSIFNKSEVNELVEILIKRINDRNWMINMAIRNFRESMKYDKKLLEARRRNFFEDFKDKG